MNHQQLFVWSLCIAAVGLVLLCVTLVWRLWKTQRTSALVDALVKERVVQRVEPSYQMPAVARMDADSNSAEIEAISAASSEKPEWMRTWWGKALLADEDAALLDQAGISLRQGGVIYVLSRLILCVLLPVAALLFTDYQGFKALMAGFFGFGIGLMLPKWVLRSKASSRRKQVAQELPLFIDLLRLLQGVGLSVDQSLHILANEFGIVLKVLSAELGLANRLYATGRTREQSLQRLNQLSADDDMAAVVNLLVQVDRHGGAVQEPLSQFALRLREKRQADFKEKIGTITVKMTGVMVLTLLPALIVITAGPGFMAVIRSLSGMNAGGG